MVLLLGHSEDGRGQWEREGSSAGLWNECVPEKTTCGAKAVCLCMIQPFIISVFQNLGSGCFFRSPAFFSESGGKICRIEVRHFFPPKGGSRYMWILQGSSHPSRIPPQWDLRFRSVEPRVSGRVHLQTGKTGLTGLIFGPKEASAPNSCQTCRFVHVLHHLSQFYNQKPRLPHTNTRVPKTSLFYWPSQRP